jgi:hypothetical protein
MDEKDWTPSLMPRAEAGVNTDSITRMLTTSRDQHVVVAPDSMNTDPVDLEWIARHDPFNCRIMLLGKYRELLLKLISAGVRVIHKGSLEEANARYLEAHPDAEGIPVRRAKPLNEWKGPFEINVPANSVHTMDIALPSEAKEVAAHIDPMHDQGLAWGIGLAIGWPGGQYVQINARTDGRWGIRQNGNEHLCGNYPKGKPATVSIRLGPKTVQLMAQVDRATSLLLIAEFPQGDFPGVPTTIRIGKIGKTWDPQDPDDKGTTSQCRVDWVKIY